MFLDPEQGLRVLFDLCIVTIFMLPIQGEQCLLVDEEVRDVVEAQRATSRETESATSHAQEPLEGNPAEPPDEVAAFHSSPSYTRAIWDDLADCESGNWLSGGGFEKGSARWTWAKPGTEVPPWGTTIHHGGLQFHPGTWDWVAPMVGLGHINFAYNATREEQILVGEKVQQLQGWRAWPVCARKLGLR